MVTGADDRSVEEWARTAHFPQPVRLGDVEAGILSRAPLKDDHPWWIPLVGYVGWLFMGLFWFFTFGASVTGTFLIWMGTRTPYADGAWLSVATMLFWVTTFAGVATLVEQRKEKGLRDALFAMLQAPAFLGCVAAYFLMRSVDHDLLPDWLILGVLACGLSSGLVLAVAVISAVRTGPRPRPNQSRKPVPRGPRSTLQQGRYLHTRERVLDILTERRLVKFDETDRIRLRGMPLGYWEELDGVDEREWRRILEHRFVGWRTFTEADRRPWPPG